MDKSIKELLEQIAEIMPEGATLDYKEGGGRPYGDYTAKPTWPKVVDAQDRLPIVVEQTHIKFQQMIAAAGDASTLSFQDRMHDVQVNISLIDFKR